MPTCVWAYLQAGVSGQRRATVLLLSDKNPGLSNVWIKVVERAAAPLQGLPRASDSKTRVRYVCMYRQSPIQRYFLQACTYILYTNCSTHQTDNGMYGRVQYVLYL